MGIKIDVKGIEDIQNKLKEIKGSLDPNTFNEWANRVAITAKQMCNDPNCKRIDLIEREQGKVTFEFADKEAIDCVIKSIQTHLSSMPPMQQEIYKRLIQEFEIKKNEAKIKSL